MINFLFLEIFEILIFISKSYFNTFSVKDEYEDLHELYDLNNAIQMIFHNIHLVLYFDVRPFPFFPRSIE